MRPKVAGYIALVLVIAATLALAACGDDEEAPEPSPTPSPGAPCELPFYNEAKAGPLRFTLESENTVCWTDADGESSYLIEGYVRYWAPPSPFPCDATPPPRPRGTPLAGFSPDISFSETLPAGTTRFELPPPPHPALTGIKDYNVFLEAVDEDGVVIARDGGGVIKDAFCEYPTPTPPAVNAPTGDYRVLFLRNATRLNLTTAGGSIWTSRLDGADARALLAMGKMVVFAGAAVEGDGTFVYAVTLDGETSRTLWRVGLAGGTPSQVLTFESRRNDQAEAAISPDGRYVAFANVDGLDLADLLTGERRRLLDNGPRDCDVGTCVGYSQPAWSPTGTLLKARKSFWEGSTTVVLDPFEDALTLHTNDSPEGPSTARWAPSGNQACGFGGYGESRLAFATAPDWLFSIGAGYEQPDWDTGIVATCDWLSEETVAFTANVSRPDADGDVVPEDSVELLVYDRASASARLVAAFGQGISISSAGLFTLPSSRWVLTQNWVTEPGSNHSTLSQPELYDIDSGIGAAVLAQGDWVVAVLAP